MKDRNEVRGTRTEEQRKNLDPRSFILDPKTSSLVPRSSILRMEMST